MVQVQCNESLFTRGIGTGKGRYPNQQHEGPSLFCLLKLQQTIPLGIEIHQQLWPFHNCLHWVEKTVGPPLSHHQQQKP